MNRGLVGIILSCLAVAGLFAGLFSQMPVRRAKVAVELESYQPWSEPVVKAAAGIPVQNDGRIKPLQTLGRFHLMSLSGKGKAYYLDQEGEPVKLTPVEWLLDCLYRPHFAAQMRVFLVEDSVVLEEIGMPESEQRKRRDLYTYRELSPYKDAILEQALTADQIQRQDGELTPLQRKIVNLRDRMVSFETVTGTFTYGSPAARVPLNDEMAKILRGRRELSFLEFLQLSYVFVARAEGAARSGEDVDPALQEAASRARFFERTAKMGLSFLAPVKKPEAQWATYGHLIESLNNGEGRQADGTFTETGERYYRDLREAGSLFTLANSNLEAFERRFLSWSAERRAEAELIPDPANTDRQVSERIVSEVAYYNRHYLHYGMGFFLLAFLVNSLGWLAPGGRFGRVSRIASLVLLIVGTAAITAAVVHRSVIMWRPPVGNLFDTIPFIVGSGCLVAVVIELITRRGLATGIGSVFGILGVFLAIRYEAGSGQDTMTPLVAVLRSNYWLTTHVITVTLGYMGALLAAAISHVYLIGRITGLDGKDKSLRRSLTRMTYGVIGFALLFSMVGTILGGVWANDSWGRFWGWDPKENGALMIVLMNLIILHARIGGLVKEFGIHILSVFGAIVVAFSWWGVNMLGVGLHSYGFTDGASTLYWFYLIEAVLIVVALLAHWIQNTLEKQRKEQARAAAGKEAAATM